MSKLQELLKVYYEYEEIKNRLIRYKEIENDLENLKLLHQRAELAEEVLCDEFGEKLIGTFLGTFRKQLEQIKERVQEYEIVKEDIAILEKLQNKVYGYESLFNLIRGTSEDSKFLDEIDKKINVKENELKLKREKEHEEFMIKNPDYQIEAFVDIIYVDNKFLKSVFEGLTDKTLILSLKTAPDEIKEKYFVNISDDRRTAILLELKKMGPITLSEIENAENEILKLVHKEMKK